MTQPAIDSIAPISRRAIAYLIDALIAVGIWVVGGVIMGLIVNSVGTVGGRTVAVMIGFGLLSLVGLAWAIVYTLMQSKAGSIGMRAQGVRLASAVDGGAIGFGRALLRNIVFGLAAQIVVGYFTPLFDSTGRFQGWHDKVANALVLDARRSPLPVAATAAFAPAATGAPSGAAPGIPGIPGVPSPSGPHGGFAAPSGQGVAAPAAPMAPAAHGVPPVPIVPPMPVAPLPVAPMPVAPPSFAPPQAPDAHRSTAGQVPPAPVSSPPAYVPPSAFPAPAAFQAPTAFSPPGAPQAPAMPQDVQPPQAPVMPMTPADPQAFAQPSAPILPGGPAEPADSASPIAFVPGITQPGPFVRPAEPEPTGLDPALDETVIEPRTPVAQAPADVTAAAPAAPSLWESPAAPAYEPAAPAYAPAGPAYAPAAPASDLVPDSAPSTRDVPIIADPVAPVPPVAAFDEPQADPHEAEIEATRISVPGHGLVFTWDDGARVTVTRRALFGRNPAHEDGTVRVSVRDETLSLSKTHFEAAADISGGWVLDRHSTNGMVIVRDGQRIACPAGQRVPVRLGDAIEIGDRIVTIGGYA